MISRLLAWLGIDATTGSFLMAILVSLGAYAHGYRYASVQAEAQHGQYVARQNQATANGLARHLRELRVEQERGDAISLQLLASNAKRDHLTDQLKQRVSHVSTVYIPKPGAAPVALPDHPFTVGWVRDYNAALGLRMPGAATATGSAARTPTGFYSPDAIDPSDLARSPVSQGDVLNNHIANAAACRQTEAQLNAILDWDEGKSP